MARNCPACSMVYELGAFNYASVDAVRTSLVVGASDLERFGHRLSWTGDAQCVAAPAPVKLRVLEEAPGVRVLGGAVDVFRAAELDDTAAVHHGDMRA